MSDPGPDPLRVVPPSAAVWAGVARRDITPPAGIYARNWGAATHDVAAGLHRPMTVTALALREGPGRPPCVLISMDAGWWQDPEDEWFIRGAVLEALALEPARCMIAFTHSHAGPSTCRADAEKPGGHLVTGYLETVRDAVVEAAREAAAHGVPATITWATGRCGLASNRDLPEPGGRRILCGFNPAAQADDTLLVGRVCDTPGRTLAVLVNYACHPTTLAWDNRLISPDYVGAMRALVETHHAGALVLFLQGSCGELAPREQYVGDTAVADRHGRQLGHAVLSVLESMLPPGIALEFTGVVESGAPLAVWSRVPFEPPAVIAARMVPVPLPLKPLPPLEQIEAEIAAGHDRVTAERLRRRLRVRRAVGPGPTCPVPAWLWRIGQALIVGQPNEAYSIFQRSLRERFPGHAVAVMNLVNGAIGYLPPAAMYDRDIYQVWQSPFERGSLELLIDTCDRHIRELLAEGVGRP